MFDRFMDRVVISNKCWEWSGYTSNRYGEFYIGKHKDEPISAKAHRVSYMFFIGEISRKEVVMHECDNTLCVNPAHLRKGTQAENVLDCVKKGRHNNQNKYKKVCKNGHSLSGDNLSVESTGFRRCQICRREYERKWRHEQRNISKRRS